LIEPLALQSETFPPTGAVASEGVQNQLGRARLNRLSLLVREAVQNSWDARAGSRKVRFSLTSWILKPGQLRVLREVVLRERAPASSIADALKAEDVRVLAVRDEETVGLGGPTRADLEAPEGEPTDFVDFIRNVGQPPDHELGGGTYGFGKAAYYLASSVRALCVYTRCKFGGVEESRFIACCLGPHFARDDGGVRRRFTGRHWWGRKAADDVVEPVVGREADMLADNLGIPVYGSGARGTTILIIAPDIDKEHEGPSLAPAVSTLLRDFWPKLIDGPGGGPTMSFSVRLDGKDIWLPVPEQLPVLAGFARAFRALAAESSTDVKLSTIRCRSPKKDLGRLAVVRFPQPGNAPPLIRGTDPEKGPFGETCRHVALLRAPNFIVKYIEGPPVPFDQTAYAGVFRAFDDVDRVFARAEPPTHDDWIPDMLEERHDRTFVRMAFVRIGEVLRAFTAPPERDETQSAEVPLGAFSDMLGGLIPSEPGIGATVRSGGRFSAGEGHGDAHQRGGGSEPVGAEGRQPHPLRVRAVGTAKLEVVDGHPALVIEYELDGPNGAWVRLGAEGAVVIEGSILEKEPPAGADKPRVLEWRDAAGVAAGHNSELILQLCGGTSSGAVAVAVPRDSMIRVKLIAQLELPRD
jgi:hypothetical protein